MLRDESIVPLASTTKGGTTRVGVVPGRPSPFFFSSNGGEGRGGGRQKQGCSQPARVEESLLSRVTRGRKMVTTMGDDGNGVDADNPADAWKHWNRLYSTCDSAVPAAARREEHGA